MSSANKKLYMDPEQYAMYRLDLRDDDLNGTEEVLRGLSRMGYHGDVDMVVTPDGRPAKEPK